MIKDSRLKTLNTKRKEKSKKKIKKKFKKINIEINNT